MLVRDTPVAVDVAQSDCQPEQEPTFLRRAAERAGAALHDGDGDIFDRGSQRKFKGTRSRSFPLTRLAGTSIHLCIALQESTQFSPANKYHVIVLQGFAK